MNNHFNNVFFIYCFKNSILNASKIFFENNKMENSHIFYLENNFYLNDSIFQNCSIDNSGILIHLSSFLSKIILFSIIIKNMIGTIFDPGLFRILYKSDLYFVLQSSFFYNNTIKNLFLIDGKLINNNYIIFNNVIIEKNNYQNSFELKRINFFEASKFDCLSNNKKEFKEKGSCILIEDILNISINNSKIFNNEGVLQIPGLIFKSIYFKMLKIYLNSLKFIKNSVRLINDIPKSYGVSLYIEKTLYFKLENSSFYRNEADCKISIISGETVLYLSEGQLVNISKCIFFDNKSYTSYILMILIGENIFIDNCIIRNNSQWTKTFSIFSRLISVKYTFFSFTNTISVNNYYGMGMIYLATLKESSFFTSDNCLFHNNIFKGNGQFTLDESLNRTFLFTNSIISDCDGTKYSTSLYVYIYTKVIYQNITLINIKFMNNTSNSATFLVVWIYSANVYVNISNCLGYYNRGIKYGGAPFNIFGMGKGFLLIIESSRFIKTESIISGMFYLYALNFYFSNSLLLDNYCEMTAGNFYLISLVEAEINNITVINSKTNNTAGIAFIRDSSSFVVKNSFFSNGNAKVEMFLIQGFSIIEMFNVSFFGFKNRNCDLKKIFSIRNTGSSKNLFYNTSFNDIDIENVFYLENSILLMESSIINSVNSSLFVSKNSEIVFSNIFYMNFYCLYENSLYFSKINMSYVYFGNVKQIVKSVFTMQNSEIFIKKIEINNVEYSRNSFFLIDLCNFDMKNVILTNFYATFINAMKIILKLIDLKTDFNYFNFENPWIMIENSEYVVIKNNNFQNYNQKKNYFSFIYLNKILNLSIVFNYFSSIKSENNGGVIILKNSNGSIINNIFLNNFAKKGGVLYFSLSQFDNILIESNNFTNNKAIINGGCIFFDIYPPILEINLYINNSARYGNIISSKPMKLNLKIMEVNQTLVQETNNLTLIFLSKITSGDILTHIFKLELYDYFNQKIIEDESFILSVSLISNCSKCDDYFNLKEENKEILRSYSGNTSSIEGATLKFFDSNYTFTFENLYLRGKPRSKVYLSFTSSDILTPSLSFLINPSLNDFYLDKYLLILPILIDDCSLGTIYSSITNICTKCLPNYYSLNISDTYCKSCASNAICYGGYNISVEEGFWRAYLNSTIYVCDRISRNCLGGIDSKCRSNSNGLLCLHCDQGYQKSINGLCEVCPHYLIVLFYYIVFFFCLFLICLFTANYFINQNDNYCAVKKVAIKQFINYFQLLLILQSYNLALPEFIIRTFFIFSNLAKFGNFWFSFDCLINTDERLDLENGIKELTIIGLMFVLVIIYSGLEKIDTVQERKKKLKKRLIIFYFILHPSFLDSFYSNIVCIKIDKKKVLQINTNKSCEEFNYFFWITFLYIPVLFLWCIFIPFFLLKKEGKKYFQSLKKIRVKPFTKIMKKTIIYNKNNVNNQKYIVKLKKKHNFLYIGYGYDPFIHEFINFYTKTLLILLNKSDYENDIKLLSILMISIYNVIYCGYKPVFRNKFNNELNFHYKILMILTGYSLIWILHNKKDDQDFMIKLFVYSILVLGHSLFLIKIIWISIKNYFFKSKQKLHFNKLSN